MSVVELSGDLDLQDFFAKKDRSKNKTSKTKSKQKKNTENNSENIVTQKTKKNKNDKDNTESITRVVKDEDDEWIDFEDPSAKIDLTLLRINTQITQQTEEESKEIETEAEKAERDKEEQGPWRQVALESSHNTDSSPAIVIEVPKENNNKNEPFITAEEPKSNPGRYIPPAKRNLGTTTMESSRPLDPISLSRMKKKVAPNITSESDFPSLGATCQTQDNGGQFESVQRGSRLMDNSSKAPSLKIGNKYNALAE